VVRSGLFAALALALLAGSACGHVPPPPAFIPLPLPRLDDCPGSLVPTHDLEGDWVIHERIRVRGGEVDEAYGLVVQKNGPRLVLVGLTPFGATAFSLTQIGVEVWSESKLGPALPVPPENVLRDLHRAHFLPSDDPDFEGRTLRRDANGSIHLSNPTCGYEATLVPVSVVNPAVAP
jgi:hypothetical protein